MSAVPRFARRVFAAALTATAAVTGCADDPPQEIAVIVGAAAEPRYAEGFAAAAQTWQRAAARASAACTVIGLGDDPPGHDDRERLRQWLAARAPAADAPLWLVYLGHGTYDERDARLNLRGPDPTVKDLADWLAPFTRPLVFVHGGSAGAPFLPALSGPNRIIISATRAAGEVNYARFGERFAAAVANPAADIDQDGQTSVLEAFVTAARQVQAFYAETGRLATEHALIDDNGDRQGTPAEWFHGVRVQRRPEGDAEPDGARARLIALVPPAGERSLTAAQRAARDVLERELTALRARKPELSEDEYYRLLEIILRRLGALYRTDS